MLLPVFGPSGMAWLSRSWNLTVVGEEHLASARESDGLLCALWHGRMLMATPFHTGQDHAILVSPSDDGGLMKMLLERHGYRVIRGSTSRGGARALRELLEELGRGGTIVITPDGPRGPRHSTNEGLAWMARKTGFPVMPLGFAVDRAWRVNSWDRCTIPKRGARVAMAYGQPLYVTAGDDLAAVTEDLRERLIATELEAHAAIGVEPDW